LQFLTAQIARTSDTSLNAAKKNTSLLTSVLVDIHTLSAQLFTCTVFGSGTLPINRAISTTKTITILLSGQTEKSSLATFRFYWAATLHCVMIGTALRDRTTEFSPSNCKTANVCPTTALLFAAIRCTDTITSFEAETRLLLLTSALTATFEALHANTFASAGLEKHTGILSMTTFGRIVSLGADLIFVTHLILLECAIRATVRLQYP
jgi:uncharacterized membrane-anchored protein